MGLKYLIAYTIKEPVKITGMTGKINPGFILHAVAMASFPDSKPYTLFIGHTFLLFMVPGTIKFL